MGGAAARALVVARIRALARAALCCLLLGASAALADVLHEGDLAVQRSEGHDCLPGTAGRQAVELAFVDARPHLVLVGFADGHVARWPLADRAFTSLPGTAPVPLAAAMREEGVAVGLAAPGTSLCRWSAQLRVRAAAEDDTGPRIARLVALEAVNVRLSEADAMAGGGKAADALPLYQEAVAERARLLGDEHPLTLTAVFLHANALRIAGKAAEGRQEVERLLSIQERRHGADAFPTTKARAGLGLMLREEGRPQDALPLLQQAYGAFRGSVGDAHVETLLVQNNLALALWDLGRLADAAALLEVLLPRVVAVRGESSPRALDAMNNLGLVYQQLGRYADALELLERAYRLGVAAMGAEHPDTLITLASVAVGYAQLDRMDDALAIYRVAYDGLVRALGPDHPWSLNVQSNVAASLLDLGRAEEARPVVAELTERATRAMGPQHIYTLRWSGMLGAALLETGDAAGAVRAYERTHAGIVAALGADHTDALEALSSLGEARYRAGDRAEALADFRAAYEGHARVNVATHRGRLTALVSLAEALAAQGRRDEAMRLLDELVATVEKLRAEQGLGGELRQAFFARWSRGYKRLAVLHGPREPAAAFRLAELSKARSLLESLALRNADMAGIVGEEAAARLASLEARASELDHLVANAPRGDDAFKLETERNAVRREAAALRGELRTRHPRYAALSEVELVSAERAATLPAAGEVLVSYLVAGDDILAFVARRGRPVEVRALGRVPGLDATVRAYRTLLAGPLAADPVPVWRRRDGSFVAALARPDDATARVVDAATVARALSDRLLRPLRSSLAGSSRLVISPDGALAALPFEALPLGGRPLVMRHEVAYVQSLSVLALMQSRPALRRAGIALLAVGAPAFGADATSARDEGVAARLTRSRADAPVARSYAARGVQWDELPGARREMEAVAALFGKDERVVRMGRDASEQALSALQDAGDLARFRYLLFSTHGYLDTQMPARSALVLSQVEVTPRFDGYLTAAKWPAYRLDSDLAVLSACETGLGRQVQGEGVMGLPYAMFVAGNRATVLTLWRIDDAASTAFVTELFRRIRGGASPSAALTAAKRTFLARGGAAAAPGTWAAFVLYGR